jgi:hypothetical protein
MGAKAMIHVIRYRQDKNKALLLVLWKFVFGNIGILLPNS